MDTLGLCDLPGSSHLNMRDAAGRHICLDDQKTPLQADTEDTNPGARPSQRPG